MEEKRATRRGFLKMAAYAGAGNVAGAAALNAASPAIWPNSSHQFRCCPDQGVIPRI